MIFQITVVVFFLCVFFAPAQAETTRTWKTVSELSETERADIDLRTETPRDSQIPYLPAKKYPFSPPYTAEEIGYRAMEFPHMPRWSAAFADGFGSITSSGFLQQAKTAGGTLSVHADGLAGYLYATPPGGEYCRWLFQDTAPPESYGNQTLMVGYRTDRTVSMRLDSFFYSPIRSLSDLNGKRFALASRDSSHAAILPLYFLHQHGIHPDKDLTLLRFDTDVGKHGDTGTSEAEVVRAVLNREADAGALGKATWDAYVAARRIDPQKLHIFWTSPGYCHCNFTARADFPAELAQRFTQTILTMDYQKPEHKRIMDLEGLTRWMTGRTEGYRELEEAAREFDMLS